MVAEEVVAGEEVVGEAAEGVAEEAADMVVVDTVMAAEDFVDRIILVGGVDAFGTQGLVIGFGQHGVVGGTQD